MTHKIGFDREKYIELQSKHIHARREEIGGKLYLEMGGKLFDDMHASRVLPGFTPDNKIAMLERIKEDVEILICINAKDISRQKVRADLGILYEDDLLRLVDVFRSRGFLVENIVMTQLEEGNFQAEAFIDKAERRDSIQAVREKIVANLSEEELADPNLGSALKKLESGILRGDIIRGGARIDGRDNRTVRPIDSEVGFLPRTHGSALFTRGETQALAIVTLGTGDDEQIIDALHGNFRSNFMLHYNFPPYSVGEVGRVGSPGRREIGHGKLAWRALQAVLPAPTDFPYTIRVVSEITESNGSSSMASVCGGSLSMMDAGVPLKAPVAGVAMGLILEDADNWAVLTDILGDEDHLGDMDFKVAGTSEGITSLQMDIKVQGITPAIMEQALAQAKEGRMHILGEMAKALKEGRREFSAHAPRIETMTIPTDKIREVIGSGGKVIREIVETSGAKVDINDDGTIKIASANADAIKKAYDMIYSIVAEPEEGKVYTGKVVKLVDFGAFVNFFGKRDGLVHVSQIANKRLQHPNEILKEGQEVKVKLLGFDDRGKVRLGMKMVDQETGEEIAEKKEETAE